MRPDGSLFLFWYNAEHAARTIAEQPRKE